MEKRTDWLDELGSSDSRIQSILNSSYFDLGLEHFQYLDTKLYSPLFRLYLGKARLDFPSYDLSILDNIVSEEVSRLVSIMSVPGYPRRIITAAIETYDLLGLRDVRRMLVVIRNEAIAFYRGHSGMCGFIGQRRLRSITPYGRAVEKFLGRKLHSGEELEVVFLKDKLAKDLVKLVIEWCTEGIRFLDYHIRRRT